MTALKKPVLSLALLLTAAPHAPAATLVVANKAEATVSLIDLDSEDGRVVVTLATGSGPHEVGISGDGASALITDYGQRGAPGSTLTLIDIPAARVVKTIDLGDYRRPHGVVWLADGRHAVVTAEDQKALLKVDVEAGKVVSAVDTGQEVSHMVALAPGGARAFVANIGSGSVTVIDLAAAEKVADVTTGDGAEGVTVAAGGRQVSNRAADTITVLDLESLEPLATLESKGFPIRATATPDGASVLVTRARAGDLAIYGTADLDAPPRLIAFDLAAEDVSGRLFGDRFGDSSVPIGVVLDSDGKRAYVAHANADVITEVDLASGETLRRLKAGKEPDGMGYSPRAASAAPASADGR